MPKGTQLESHRASILSSSKACLLTAAWHPAAPKSITILVKFITRQTIPTGAVDCILRPVRGHLSSGHATPQSQPATACRKTLKSRTQGCHFSDVSCASQHMWQGLLISSDSPALFSLNHALFVVREFSRFKCCLSPSPRLSHRCHQNNYKGS